MTTTNVTILFTPGVIFAAERTLLAWVRTGLALMGFGFVVPRFGLFLRELAALPNVPPRPHSGFSLWVGTTLVVLGVAIHVGRRSSTGTRFAVWTGVSCSALGPGR
jgi:uncharacterized membrane protein YidH (DUF202 family)